MDQQKIPIDEHHDASAPARSKYRRAIIVSVVFHVILIAVLLVWYIPKIGEQEAGSPAASTQKSVESTTPKPIPSQLSPQPAPDVPAEEIQASINSQLEQVDRLSDERKLSELEKNLKRLEAVSSEESVQEVTTTIADKLGLQPGAVPDADAEGEFEFDSAQLHDVTRKRSDSGVWEYESVLVDSSGRTQTVPMTPAEGESAYAAFEQMKKFPLAAGIYRQVVMPLIQKSIEASELAAKAALEAQRVRRDESEDESKDESY